MFAYLAYGATKDSRITAQEQIQPLAAATAFFLGTCLTAVPGVAS